MQEGQVWEALSYYPKTGMKSLVPIIDWNKGQNDGYSKDFSSMYENLKERITSFGWNARLIDGHNMDEIRTTLSLLYFPIYDGTPLCIILDTMKGKGVSFMESPSWHAKVPTEEQYKLAIKELGV